MSEVDLIVVGVAAVLGGAVNALAGGGVFLPYFSGTCCGCVR
ncbi:MAG: sulfite exporter TauE/SafE family protein, partial [Nitrospirae bacterium]|nr:sulfite exporter TauE/SafE family protein [Nitrospirota bacterium]